MQTKGSKGSKAERDSRILSAQQRNSRAVGMAAPFHYYATSSLHWTVDADLLACLDKQRQRDTDKRAGLQATMCTVFRVAGPADRPYEIDEYKPVVPEGELQLVATVIY